MAIIGAQHQSKPTDLSTSSALPAILKFLNASPDLEPAYVELASVTDTRGFYNETAIAYWPTASAFESWSSKSGFGSWFKSLDAPTEPNGWFLELFLPTVECFETVFSDNTVPEGAAHMREGVSGEILEHVYWGSMRDRMAAAQTDHLTGEKWLNLTPSTNASEPSNAPNAPSEKRRITVPGKQNLAIIRSGQDWSDTLPHERTLYLDTMHPVLTTGMNFLRDSGAEVGCFSCRFMDVVDRATYAPRSATGANTDKTFGLAYFDDLASLEGWSKRHKTHLDIFGRFLQYAKELDNQLSLRLFHEVMVLEPGQQRFEYVGCHDGTGMLASL